MAKTSQIKERNRNAKKKRLERKRNETKRKEQKRTEKKRMLLSLSAMSTLGQLYHFHTTPFLVVLASAVGSRRNTKPPKVEYLNCKPLHPSSGYLCTSYELRTSAGLTLLSPFLSSPKNPSSSTPLFPLVSLC
jgi:hypothetical protein